MNIASLPAVIQTTKGSGSHDPKTPRWFAIAGVLFLLATIVAAIIVLRD